MSSPAKADAKKRSARIPLNVLLTAVGEKKRWAIFRELAKGKPLPVSELAKRAGISPTSTSKHMLFLHGAGIVERGFGGLYELIPGLTVPNENAIDFGPVVLRFDEAG